MSFSTAERLARELTSDLKDWRRANAWSVVQELCDFIALPNESGDAQQAETNALALGRMMERRAIHTKVLRIPGAAPLVTGELWRGDSLPTLLVYCHYDGVAVIPSEWHSAPYVAVLRKGGVGTAEIAIGKDEPRDDWRLYGRSTADAKGTLIALLAALDALAATGRGPGVNLRFLIDGEEERESPNLEAYLTMCGDFLDADLLIAAEGPLHPSGRPTVDFGVRGILTFTLTVHTAAEELHSGHFAGFAPSAPYLLAALIASMRDAEGTVLIDGFYDDVLPLTAEEREALERIAPIEDDIRSRYGLGFVEGGGRSLQELINRPTFNVRGLESGGVGAAARNVVPHRATADIDVRLVADMDFKTTFERILDHVRRRGFHVVDCAPAPGDIAEHGRVVEAHMHAGFNAVRTPMAMPIAGDVLALVQRGAGEPPLVQPTEGGSLPFHRFAARGLPFVGIPAFNSDSNQHAADENLQLGTFFRAIDTFASLFLWR